MAWIPLPRISLRVATIENNGLRTDSTLMGQTAIPPFLPSHRGAGDHSRSAWPPLITSSGFSGSFLFLRAYVCNVCFRNDYASTANLVAK